MVARLRARCVCTCVGLVLAAASIEAQTALNGSKPLVFEVVSIRQDQGSPSRGMPQFGATVDGYQSVNQSLMIPLLSAFVPSHGVFFQPDQVSGMPSWAMQERYDVSAKVGEADLAAWQKSKDQPAMLRQMLQAMFVDRCKLVVHRESKESSVQFLVVAKSGPKFKETDPNETHQGIVLPFGGVLVPGKDGMTAYGISMDAVATFASGMMGNGQTVIDKTGLTGRYDITAPMRQAMEGGNDPGSVVITILDGLGLKLESGKAQVETLVIDHMERPSEN